ncbi:unnamed protein product [Porites lobata]|uniref:Uncharacterized protein n=1 Tax=Porites lobata TaxID=104759 RepID=A0ABN8QJ79_9CNID|nr:unnamed protein product [Porites lobata]
MAAFLWARRLNQSSFLGLGLYAGDLKSRKQGLLRRDFSTEEIFLIKNKIWGQGFALGDTSGDQ